MKIGEIAKKSDLPIKTVRYYADIGLVTPSGRSDAGYRLYDLEALKQLIFIRRARSFDFSIDQCRELLALYTNHQRSAADVKKLASAHLEMIQKKQLELQHLHDELAHLVNACHGDERPNCPIIDFLG
ncbi:Cu(I)-responsive transcriptional regulator [Amylibacter marinus]|uniref:Cu(I)-responsive transcriptional regulator n=1 Tax=Amylibacter marinus TaxID=1475483 RepID=A0ABQ5VSS0_9RHOB|nr:MerR family DNA-binding protein [Amylibacter marinus]GLQ34475.1 Cu(I)-responsive transcriptional regulator [Amylibacter marinus]